MIKRFLRWLMMLLMPKSERTVDLEKGRVKLMAGITQGVRQFVSSAEAAKLKPITVVDLRFDLCSEQYPRVWLMVDTHPDGEERSGSSDELQVWELVRKDWAFPCHMTVDGKSAYVKTGEKSVKVNDELALYAAVGPFLAELMQKLRDAGVFKPLRRGKVCYYGASAEGGEWGWPSFEERAKHVV